MSRRRRSLPVGLVLPLLAALASCGRPDPGAAGGAPLEGPAAGGPILLITLSGWRPDAVGALGGESFWTPHIDRFADRADWVGTAVAASSEPPVSLVSLMTGVPAWQHRVLGHAAGPARAGIPRLAQAVGAAGYRAVARVPMDRDLDRYGLFDGFDEVAEIEPIDDTAKRLRGLAEQPATFCWLHLREADAEYERRDGELPRLAARSAGLPDWITAARLLGYADPRVALPDGERALAWNLFRHEVAWADHQVGEVLAAVRQSGLWERAWVVLTATQGTELGEHGQVLYAQNLGRVSIEVPLMIKLPGGRRGALRTAPAERVGLSRLWATLVEAVGQRAPPAQALSLFRTAAPPIVSELYHRNGVNEFSLLAGDLQLLWSTRFAAQEPEFYAAQLVASGGRYRLSEPSRSILGRLRREFRRTQPFSGALGGPAPSLRLERWTAGGTVPVEDRERALELAGELYRRLTRFIEKERTPGEESALSGSLR